MKHHAKKLIAIAALALPTAALALDNQNQNQNSQSAGQVDTGTSSNAQMSSKSGASDTGLTSSARHLSSDQIRDAEQKLKDKGYDVGKIDGKMDRKFKVALRKFQRDNGMKVTGRLDAGTMSQLGVQQAGTVGNPDASSNVGASSNTGGNTGRDDATQGAPGNSTSNSDSGSTGNTSQPSTH